MLAENNPGATASTSTAPALEVTPEFDTVTVACPRAVATGITKLIWVETDARTCAASCAPVLSPTVMAPPANPLPNAVAMDPGATETPE